MAARDWSGLTMGGLLDEVAGLHPEVEAVVDLASGARMSYGQLAKQSDAFALGLIALGLEPGDHLALWAGCHPQWMVVKFGAAKAGLVLTNLDPSAGKDQLSYQLVQSDCKVLVTGRGVAGDEFLDVLRQVCPELGHGEPGAVKCAEFPHLDHVVLMSGQAPGMHSWDKFLAQGQALGHGALRQRMDAISPDDVACLFYTSGTTGEPKGVMNTHGSLIATSAASAENLGLSPKDRLCLSVPISHLFGCVCVALCGVTAASTLVIPGRVPDANNIMEAVAQERCTAVFGPPTTFIGLWEHPQYAKRDLSSLRTGIMAGATCPIEVMKRVVGEMGVSDIIVGYGQTESSTWISQTRASDPLELRVSSVGRPISGVEVKIVDPSSGEEAESGQVGELCSRGYNMTGYYKLPSATAGSLDAQGWLHTGDLATMDSLGYLRIAGRLKEVIRRAGRAVLPAEVEDVIFTHPQVVNAQVFGVPDDQLGEEVAVWIKLGKGAGTTEEDMAAWLAENLDDAKLPRLIKFVDEYPMTNLGKIQKFRMSQMYAEELGR